MSRIGRKPVVIPDKVKVEQTEGWLAVAGPLGSLKQSIPSGLVLNIEGAVATFAKPVPTRNNAGFQGLARALLANMVEGVTKGYEKTLVINGVGYKAELNGNTIGMTLGFSHPVALDLPEGIKAEVDKSGTTVKISGTDKQMVGQVAAQLRAYKPCEPYKGKGVRYGDEIIRRKVGKAGAK